MSTSPVTQIAINTNVRMIRALKGGPSTTTNTLLDDSQIIPFESYSEGSVIIGPGTANYPLLPSSELVLISSDKPVDVIMNLGESQILIPATKRFSIDSVAGVSIRISNTSETDSAVVSFLTTNKPAPATV